MSKLDSFAKQPSQEPQRPDAIEWSASVLCQVCGEQVDDQLYFPSDSVLAWTCSENHRSLIENFKAF